ncbi:MAG: hypothetical protein FJW95_11405 [Actinobacteria bacterium]|nr:hypothetical protein [Actinomycetota bacterium]
MHTRARTHQSPSRRQFPSRLARVVRTALLALVSVGAVGTAVAPSAQAAIVAASAQTSVEYGNANCGDTVMGAPVIGNARFLRSGDRMTTRYVMSAGDANTQYEVWLYDGDACAPLRRLGTFSSDAAGAGAFTSKQVGVAGSSRFYAVAVDLSTFPGLVHSSLAVDLP